MGKLLRILSISVSLSLFLSIWGVPNIFDLFCVNFICIIVGISFLEWFDFDDPKSANILICAIIFFAPFFASLSAILLLFLFCYFIIVICFYGFGLLYDTIQKI